MFLCFKKTYKFLFLLLACAIIPFTTRAATIDTVSIYSKSMQKTFSCVVITPKQEKKKKISYPVVYLLHGYAGSYDNWIRLVPELSAYADEYKMMIVCPDGGFSSWYFDSPVDSSMRYETYIGEEVPAYIDQHYPVIRTRQARAITGLSMGGHGALFLGFRHADRFGACGSMSGGVDMNTLHTRYDVSKRLGDTIAFADNWKKYSVTTLVEKYPKDSLAIIFDCGTEDFFYAVNHRLHEKMLQLKIPHDYIERTGAHNWAYWRNAVRYQLLFFRNYFNKMQREI